MVTTGVKGFKHLRTESISVKSIKINKPNNTEISNVTEVCFGTFHIGSMEKQIQANFSPLCTRMF